MNIRSVREGAARSAFVIAVTLAALAALSLPASAAPPLIERHPLEFTGSFDCGGGVTYDIDLDGMLTVQTFMSDDGPTRIVEHWNWLGYAEASTGTVLRVHHAFSVTMDFVAGTFTVRGLPFGTWVHGSPLLYAERGIVVFEFFGLDGNGDPILGAPLHIAGNLAPPDPHGHTCDLIAAAA